MSKRQCPRCLIIFDRDFRLISHMKKLPQCNIVSAPVIIDDDTHKCDKCGAIFTRKFSLKRHMKESCKLTTNNTQISKLIGICEFDMDESNNTDDFNKYPYECEYCQSLFTGEEFLDAHLKSECRLKQIDFDDLLGTQTTITNNDINISSKEIDNSVIRMAEKIKELEIKLNKNEERLDLNEKRMDETVVISNSNQTIIKNIKDKSGNNNILQVVCVSEGQNFLDMLTEHWGDYGRALEFIKDCALSSLTGDCRLIERIYFSGDNEHECPIRFLDAGKKKIEYINEKKERVIDIGGVRLARILASNLQNSYLQGVNYLINQNLDNKRCPLKFLGDYDIQSWNNHIYDLCDFKYQKKIVGNLDIPVIKPITIKHEKL